VNVLSCDTSCQSSRVYLVVSGFDVVSVFCNEGNGDFGPGSVFPVSSDHKRDDSKAVRSDGFNGEKLVRAVLRLKIVDGCNYLKKVHKAIPGLFLNTLSRV